MSLKDMWKRLSYEGTNYHCQTCWERVKRLLKRVELAVVVEPGVITGVVIAVVNALVRSVEVAWLNVVVYSESYALPHTQFAKPEPDGSSHPVRTCEKRLHVTVQSGGMFLQF